MSNRSQIAWWEDYFKSGRWPKREFWLLRWGGGFQNHILNSACGVYIYYTTPITLQHTITTNTITLRYTTLLYTDSIALYYNYNCNCYYNYNYHYIALHYTTIATTLLYTTLDYTTLTTPHHNYTCNCNCNYTPIITLHSALYKNSLYKKMRGWVFLPHICFVEYIYICKWKLRNSGTLEF